MAKAETAPVQIRIVGTRPELERLVTVLSDAGIEWATSGHFYPRIGEPNRFSYYLDRVQAPSQHNAKESSRTAI